MAIKYKVPRTHNRPGNGHEIMEITQEVLITRTLIYASTGLQMGNIKTFQNSSVKILAKAANDKNSECKTKIYGE